MLLFNITYIMEEATAPKWLQWMQESHIPRIMATEHFVSYRLLKVLDSPNEGVTYCAQYVAENMAEYLSYQSNHAPAFESEVSTNFENQLVSFQTLMEYID